MDILIQSFIKIKQTVSITCDNEVKEFIKDCDNSGLFTGNLIVHRDSPTSITFMLYTTINNLDKAKELFKKHINNIR